MPRMIYYIKLFILIYTFLWKYKTNKLTNSQTHSTLNTHTYSTKSPTLRLQYIREEWKETRTGKKLSGTPLAVKSMAAVGAVLSITGIRHTSEQWARSYSCSPSQSLITGGGAPEASGMVMVTSLSSISVFSKVYSMLTSHPPAPFSWGQQLTGEW